MCRLVLHRQSINYYSKRVKPPVRLSVCGSPWHSKPFLPFCVFSLNARNKKQRLRKINETGHKTSLHSWFICYFVCCCVVFIKTGQQRSMAEAWLDKFARRRQIKGRRRFSASVDKVYDLIGQFPKIQNNSRTAGIIFDLAPWLPIWDSRAQACPLLANLP